MRKYHGFYIHSLTNQNEIRNSEYNVFFYLVPILLAAWVIGLFLLLVGKMKQVKQVQFKADNS